LLRPQLAGDHPGAGQRHALLPLPAHLRGDRLVPQEAAAGALGRPREDPPRGGKLLHARLRRGAPRGRPAARRAARGREPPPRGPRYSGLSTDFVLRANLRVGPFRYEKELLRDRGQTIGRLDSRFLGSDIDSVGEFAEYDPASTSTDGPYVAMLNDYLRRELGFKDDHVYERLADIQDWTTAGFEFRYPYLGEPLREAMVKNPDLQVLVTSGRFDLATPYFDAAYTAHHLALPEALRGHMKLATYDAGHMMYIRKADHQKLKKDIAEFIREAAKKKK